MNDPDATVEVMRIYNDWLADFCSTRPERFAGLASIPNNPLDAAIAEVERVAKRGAVRGLDIANSPDLLPLWDPHWNPLWEVIQACGLPLHFHTIGSRLPDDLQKLVFMGGRARAPRRSAEESAARACPSPRTSPAFRSTCEHPHGAHLRRVEAILACAWCW